MLLKQSAARSLHTLYNILSHSTLDTESHGQKQVCTEAMKKAVHMCILKHVNKSRGRRILTLVTHSYLSLWPHSLVAVRPLSLWKPWHQQHAGGQVLFERGSEWKEEMEDKKSLQRREGKKWERGWKKREEILLVSVATLASSLYVTRATAVCKPACDPKKKSGP